MKAKLRQFELHTSNIARAQIANDDSQNTLITQNTPITPITPTTPTTQTTPITPSTPTTPTIKKNATGQMSDGIYYLFWI